MKEEYNISQETKDLMNKHLAYKELKDDYLALRWASHWLVVRCAIKAEKYRNLFWEAVYEEHPNLTGKTLFYSLHTYKISIHDE